MKNINNNSIKNYYVACEKVTGDLLFGDRLFDRVGDVKNAYFQLGRDWSSIVRRNKLPRRFDDQDVYEIREVTMTVQEKEPDIA